VCGLIAGTLVITLKFSVKLIYAYFLIVTTTVVTSQTIFWSFDNNTNDMYNTYNGIAFNSPNYITGYTGLNSQALSFTTSLTQYVIVGEVSKCRQAKCRQSKCRQQNVDNKMSTTKCRQAKCRQERCRQAKCRQERCRQAKCRQERCRQQNVDKRDADKQNADNKMSITKCRQRQMSTREISTKTSVDK
jgi:hypothetical protein